MSDMDDLGPVFPGDVTVVGSRPLVFGEGPRVQDRRIDWAGCAQLDQLHHRLSCTGDNVRDPQVGGPAVTFAHTLPFVKIAVILNSRPVELLLDTAASSLMLFRAPWPRSAESREG